MILSQKKRNQYYSKEVKIAITKILQKTTNNDRGNSRDNNRDRDKRRKILLDKKNNNNISSLEQIATTFRI